MIADDDGGIGDGGADWNDWCWSWIDGGYELNGTECVVYSY